MANQASDVLRVGVPTCGGIATAMKTLAFAEAFGMECELHGSGSGSLAPARQDSSCVEVCGWGTQNVPARIRRWGAF
ncbi:enolase C-terminal domain-like protein [Kribbella sp. NPDC003505]|uniref:enolase C-terminal domain-like protein n=1 Tax=Kribbella sp. NPDC003505 TaxID=3154448 RepID=UPI00339EDBA1